MVDSFCGSCSKMIHGHGHGRRRWEEVKHIAHGAHHTTISLSLAFRRPDLPRLVVVKYADIDRSHTLQRQRQLHSLFQGCLNIIQCYRDECTTHIVHHHHHHRMVYNVLFEHASGGNVADFIKNSGGGGLPESDVKAFTKSILLGLDHIHKKGYAHLDIKPKNILLVKDSSKKKRKRGKANSAGFVAKKCDLWIAKSSKQISAELQWEDRWCLEGTPRYMSPELIAEHKKGPACDVWGLGCVVVEMLCGHSAFSIRPSEGLEDFLDRIGFGEELPRIPDGISEEARDFLDRCFGCSSGAKEESVASFLRF